MNKQQSPLDNLVQSLTNSLTKSNGNGRKKSQKQRRRRSKKSGSNPVRLNPGNRGDVGQSLTRTQFTASSPLNLFNVTPGSTPGGVRVRGRELIATWNVGPTATTGAFRILTNQIGDQFLPVSPYIFPRLSNYQPIYEYYKFHRVTYTFQSNQPTTQAGTIALCCDYDPTDAAPANTPGILRNVSSVMSNIYSDNSFQVLGSLSRLPKYECETSFGSEALQVRQGMIYASVEGLSVGAGTVVGYTIAEYDVEFYTPQ